MLLQTVLCVALILGASNAKRTYPMDRASTCGQRIKVGEDPIIVTGRGDITTSNPVTRCELKLEAEMRSNTKNRFEITIKSVTIRDTAKLEIFDHDGNFGKYLKVLDRSYTTNEIIYSTSPIITLRYTRPDDLYQFNSDFNIEFKAYSDDETGASVFGATKLKSWHIAIIVVGIVVLIGAAVFLLVMYARGVLPGMAGPPHRMRRERILRSSDPKKPAVGEKAGVDNPSVSKSVESLAEEGRGNRYPDRNGKITGQVTVDRPGQGVGRNGQYGERNRSTGRQPPSQPPPSLDSFKNGRLPEKPRMYSQNGEPRQVGRAAVYHPVTKSVDIGNGANVAMVEPFSRTDPVRSSGGSLSSEKRGQRARNQNRENEQIEPFSRNDPIQSSSGRLRSGQRLRDRPTTNKSEQKPVVAVEEPSQKTDAKTDDTGKKPQFFKNPDAEGYHYSYDHLYPDGKKKSRDQNIDEHNRETESSIGSHETNIDDLTDDNISRGDKPKTDEHFTDNRVEKITVDKPSENHKEYGGRHAPDYYAKIDQHAEPNQTGKMSNPLHPQGQIRSRVDSAEELDNDSDREQIKKNKNRPKKSENRPVAKTAPQKFIFPDPNRAKTPDDTNRSHSPSYNTILSRTSDKQPTYPYDPQPRSYQPQPQYDPNLAGKASTFMQPQPRSDPYTQQHDPNTRPTGYPNPPPQRDPNRPQKPKSAFSAFQPPPSYADHQTYPQPDDHRAYPQSQQPVVNQLSFHNQSLRNDQGGQLMLGEPQQRQDQPTQNSAHHRGRGDNDRTVIHAAPKKSSAIKDKISVSDI